MSISSSGAELRRDDQFSIMFEALAWFQGLRENTVAELAFLGPSLLREAAIHRRAGRVDDALRLQERFDRLWQSSDEAFRASVVERYSE